MKALLLIGYCTLAVVLFTTLLVVDLEYLFFVFSNISPYFWSALGLIQCVGLSILGAAW